MARSTLHVTPHAPKTLDPDWRSVPAVTEGGANYFYNRDAYCIVWDRHEKHWNLIDRDIQGAAYAQDSKSDWRSQGILGTYMTPKQAVKDFEEKLREGTVTLKRS